LQELEREAAEREEAQRKAESARLDEIVEVLREEGFPAHADRVEVMTNLDQFYDAFKGELRRDLRAADWDLTDALDQERDDRITAREAEEEAHRKEEQEAEQKAKAEREAEMSPEELEAQAAADAADLTAQVLEDSLQQLVDQTTEALEADDDYSNPSPMKFPGDQELRPMPVERDATGNAVLDAAGHATPRPFRSSYRDALESGAGLFGVKVLADQLIELPRALRDEWWSQRSEAERHALARAFGLRPPVGKDEVIHGDNT
jgi:hypothetical protein